MRLFILSLLLTASVLAEDIKVDGCNGLFSLSELEAGDRLQVTSHEGFDQITNYSNNVQCVNDFQLGEACEEMSFSCDFFDVRGPSRRQCRRGDYVMLHDGADLNRKRFCGRRMDDVTTTMNRLRFVFRSNRIRPGRGFSCFVQCSRPVTNNNGNGNTDIGNTDDGNTDIGNTDDGTVSDQSDDTCFCGRANSRRRVIGGTITDQNEFPWQVAMVQAGRTGIGSLRCGGVLLNKNWAISAAHCTFGITNRDIELVMGEHDFEQENLEFPAVRRRVKRIVDHPDYDNNLLLNDYTLLEMATPLESYSKHVKPICMPTITDDLIQRVIVTGWGTTQEGSLSAVLKKVEVPIVERETCRNQLSILDSFIQLTSNMICAGEEEGGSDTCQGDSGGPAIYRMGGNSDEERFFELGGLTSFGVGCGNANSPGVYAYVKGVEGWIRQYVSEDNSCPRLDSGLTGDPISE